MRQSSVLAGLIGLVLVLFGILGYVLTTGILFARLFILLNLIGGVLALIGWISSSWGNLGALAGKRTTRYGANAALYSLAFIFLLIAVNYLASRYPHQFDLTVEKAFSLSPQSLQIVKQLKQPLKLYGFVQNGHNLYAEELYGEYAYASPLISYELIDPVKNPEMAERYHVSVNNTTHIQYGGEKGEGNNVTDVTEAAITNGISKVVKSGSKTAYFLTGEGEPDLSDAQSESGFAEYKKALEGENYEVKTLTLASAAKIPDDCTVLVLAGPTRPLLPHEIDAMNDYLKRGGRALVMLRPAQPDGSVDEAALVKFVADWGVKAGDDIVVDQVVRLFAGPALGLSPLVNNYQPHPITVSFNKQTVFPMVRSVDPIDPPKPGLTVTPLAQTSDTSWAETDLKSLFERQTAKLDPSDKKGPINVAAAVEANLKLLHLGDGAARLVVLGDTEAADNQHINDFFNRDFIMNSIDWLAGEANAITIRPRTLRASRFDLTVEQFDVVFVMSVLLLPELLLIVGIAVWWERRT
jgi:ABC-type uncharacterized transport system involved in gliding motility auxiliary subunit